MSLLYKYAMFKAGLVDINVNITMQKFFKTNPTEEQLILMQRLSDQAGALYMLLAALFCVFGVVIGYVLCRLELIIEVIKTASSGVL